MPKIRILSVNQESLTFVKIKCACNNQLVLLLELCFFFILVSLDNQVVEIF